MKSGARADLAARFDATTNGIFGQRAQREQATIGPQTDVVEFREGRQAGPSVQPTIWDNLWAETQGSVGVIADSPVVPIASRDP